MHQCIIFWVDQIEAVQACQGAGLDPFVGFFHQPAYGCESLACDLIEPLHPRIDT